MFTEGFTECLLRWLLRHSLTQSRRAFSDSQRHAMPHVKRCRIAHRDSFTGGKTRQRKLADCTRAGDDSTVALKQCRNVTLAQQRIRRKPASDNYPSTTFK